MRTPLLAFLRQALVAAVVLAAVPAARGQAAALRVESEAAHQAFEPGELPRPAAVHRQEPGAPGRRRRQEVATG